MNRRKWTFLLATGAAVVAIVVVGTFLLRGEESLYGKIVKLEGNTVTLQGEGGQTTLVKLQSVEGLKEGAEVEIEGYDPATMVGENVRVVRQ